MQLMLGFATCCFMLACTTKQQEQGIQKQSKVSLIRSYHANGQLDQIGAKVDSLRQGYWVWYDTCGIVQGECTYLDGKMTGPFNLYYPNGNLKSEVYGVDGVWVGESTTYHYNGNVWRKGTLNNDGEYDGIWEEYLEDGTLYEKTLWRAGKLVKTFDVDE